ncbi:hypothetical protein [Pantoea coffeiphila]|uniref:hypothetical protein n=1 Tax=Pantoea coffeiphila TaxID=1465635 RepID=UPI0011AFD66B|nr:hypothetical protein [Pantoea coffeiphila]
MEVSGHYVFNKNPRVDNSTIESTLQSAIGTKGRVCVYTTTKGQPLVVVYEVDEDNLNDVVNSCHNVGKIIGAIFYPTIDGGTIEYHV